MSTGISANETSSACTAPLLDESLFRQKGGYLPGRYCGLGAFQSDAGTASCCFPCPIQDYIYAPNWRTRLRIPNYLSILSVTLCAFLLLSFLALPPSKTHRHYLSVGLLIPVLLISLSFSIPVTTNPDYCNNAITPADMYASMSCAWTGSLITLGGLGCVVWVFLRSAWLFVRIVFDVAPGRRFMWASIATGLGVPVVFLVAVLTRTGFSYRMGQTCLPNHEDAIVTFWTWLVLFAALGFVLQVFTTGYCVWVYVKTLRRERSNPNSPGFRRDLQTWGNVKKLFLLQWRNILVSVFVLAGSLVFFFVFWTQDRKLGSVLNDSRDITQVKTWIICQTLSRGDKKECRKYVKGFTVREADVLVALILASLVGIEIFILLFRRSMAQAWLDLFKRLPSFYQAYQPLGRRPQTPELTTFENPDKYSLPSPAERRHGSRFVEGLEIVPSSSGSYEAREQIPPPLRSPPPHSPADSPPPPVPTLQRENSKAFRILKRPLLSTRNPHHLTHRRHNIVLEVQHTYLSLYSYLHTSNAPLSPYTSSAYAATEDK
ncbi:hypothetical protein PTNB85_06782 [Pyrenophora teres f. teres]|nr:hypothetical protein HRS9139_08045 [Pyrenophora teres f. teres]KAE8832390.1 hypothetical protein PTNB85_06782 [Pyrenophora teres f. teres]KAE8856052.1 hypothetical protein PTNB29_08891 [Pyrenophora teres f. teres]